MRHTIFSGALIVVAMRWTDRLIGLFSTLVLARLLAPGDFGVVAMASVVVGLADVLLDLGVNVALIQNRDADEEDYSTAWTIRLIQGAIAGALILLAAPFSAEYYDDPRVVDVMQIMALTIFLGGFENIGVVAFQKKMQFGLDFKFFFLKRLVGVFVTLGLALWLHSYWAMIIGALAGRTAGVALSFAMHPLRPRITLSRFRTLWSFSQWVLVRNIGGYADTKLDKFVLGGRSDAATVGGYTLADEIASIPTSELLAPLGRVLFPAFVDARHDPVLLANTFLRALAIQALIVIPAGIGIALVAEPLVLTLLGQQWVIAIQFIEIIALLQIVLVLSHAASYLLLAVGKVKLLSIYTWGQVAIFIVLAMTLSKNVGAVGIAWLRFSVAVFGLFCFIVIVLKNFPELSAKDFVRAIFRPILAAGLMASVVINSNFVSVSQPVLLLTLVFTGAITYCVAILLLWRIAGCPDGPESYLLEKIHVVERVIRFLGCSTEKKR